MANWSAVSSISKLTDIDHYLDFVEPLEKQFNEDHLYVTWDMHKSQNGTYNNNEETIVSTPADSSDGLIKKPSPEIQLQVQTKITGQFSNPAAPQIYHTAQSSYQSMDQTNFSTEAQLGYNYSNLELKQNQYSEQINWEQTQYKQEYHEHNRFYPYNMQGQVSQVSSLSSFYGKAQTQKDNTRTDLVSGDVCLFKEQEMFTEQNSCRFEPNIFPWEKEFDYKNQKSFMCDRQKILLGVQMPLTTDYSRQVDTSNLEMTSQECLFNCPAAPQITSARPTKPKSSTYSTWGKGANRKSNETKRPKMYNCTTCNKWFTSSGHLERHYNTALHRNAMRSTGQPDPACLPTSNHYHSSGDLLDRTQQLCAELNTHSPVRYNDTELQAEFNHFDVNSYSPWSTYPLELSVLDLSNHNTHLSHTYQQATAPSYRNGMAQVMNKALNDLPIADAATFCASSEADVPHGNTVVSKAIKRGRNIIRSNANNIYILKVDNSIDYANKEDCGFQANYPVRLKCAKAESENQRSGYIILGKTTKPESDSVRSNESNIQVLNIEYLTDYENKENCGLQVKFPARLRSAKAENESRRSPAMYSTVPSIPLAERNQVNKSTSMAVHKCYMCDKSFIKGCYLTQHNKTYHSGVKTFKCIRCGKRFSDTAAYEKHCVKHLHNKPFKCSECPKSYNHKSDLRRHMCLHSDYMPFTCDHCGKGFIRNDHMIKHFATHEKRLRSSSSPTSTQSVSSTS